MSEVVLPTFEEVQAVSLASTESATITAKLQAQRAANLGNALLGLDKQYLEDLFTGQLESMGDDRPTDGLVTIDPNIGWKDEDGNILQPGLVVARYNELAARKDIPGLSPWDKMYANRTAAWWNKALPQQEAAPHADPARIVFVDPALQGLTKDWVDQQELLTKHAEKNSSDSVSAEGLKPLSWIGLDASALESEGKIARPDEETFNRFVQHEKDVADRGVGYGPNANVYGGQADLNGSSGVAGDGNGFRVSMGPNLSL